MALPALADHRLSFLVREVLDSLVGGQVELDPVPLPLRTDETEGVAAESVHVPVGGRDATVAHHDGHLVQGLGQRAPEVPVVQGAAQVRAGVALDGVVQIGELQGVTQEKDGRVVPHEVPVPLFSVELDGEAPDVALRIGGASLARHGGKADKALGFLADLREKPGPGIPGDVLRDGERAERPRTLRVHPPLRDHLPVEVGELFQVPDVLQQNGAARPRGHGVLVVDDGCAATGGEPALRVFFPGHFLSLSFF